MKIALNLCFFLGIAVRVDHFSSSRRTMFFVMTILLQVFLAIMMARKDTVLKGYLDKLQEKFVEERSWKHLVNDLQEGIILIKKDFKILYKNKTSCTIFGLKISEKDPQHPLQTGPDPDSKKN
jgi:hypothetical protein